MSQPQQFAPSPQPPLPPRRKLTTKLILAAVVAVVLVATATAITLALTLSSSGAKTFTLRGTMTVTCSSSYGSISSYTCSGYSDLHSGAQVEVYNEKREILATGNLLTGSAPTASTGGYSSYSSLGVVTSYVFVIPDVPRGAKQYGVHIGNNNRGIIWETEEIASTTGFALSIGN